MRPVERVFKAIKFEKPDRVPISTGAGPGALLKYGQELIDILKKYPNDFSPPEWIKIPERKKEFYDEKGNYFKEYIDEWGCKWEEYKEGIGGQVKSHPLSDWSVLADFKVADFKNDIDEMKKNMDKMKGVYPLWGGAGNFYERLQWLRGYENLMIDLTEDRTEIQELADRILYEYTIPRVKELLDYGAEIICIFDDWGTQTQLMISPKIWRSFFKPRYKEVFQLIHQEGAFVWFHSDGYMMEIIEDLIEIGLDVLNPQFSCMDLKELAKLVDHRLCIASDPDRQYLLPFGAPVEVREYIKQFMSILGGPDGGLIAMGDIGTDVSLENVMAMYDAFLEFGQYKT